jgi:hypothetical protein
MQRLICSLFCLAGAAWAAAPAFESRENLAAELKENEAVRYDRLKKIPGIKRIKLVSVDEAAFSQNDVRLDLFDGKRGEFKMFHEEGNDALQGKGTNLNRIAIREIDGRYSGQILYNGKQFVLTPVAKGVSALYEVDANVRCGVSGHNKESSK